MVSSLFEFFLFYIPSETFSFVLTGEDGSRRFGYCRRLLVRSENAPARGHKFLLIRVLIKLISHFKAVHSMSSASFATETYLILFVSFSLAVHSPAGKAEGSLKSTVSSAAWDALTSSLR